MTEEKKPWTNAADAKERRSKFPADVPAKQADSSADWKKEERSHLNDSFPSANLRKSAQSADKFRLFQEVHRSTSHVARLLKRKHPTMEWLHLLAYFFGGAFLANAVPHSVSGLLGRPFQTPFAKPPGEGLSSSTVNVCWGFLNLVVAYLLLCRVGDFDWRSTAQVAAAGSGALLLSLMLARHFGKFHGGNSPGGS